MKSYGTPGKSIVTCFKIACFFLLDGVKAKKPQDPKKAEYDPEGYFELAKQRLLNNPKGFLDQLIRYEKDSIPDILVERVRPYMTLDEMKDENVKKASQALFPVKIWIVAMLEYHETLKIVNPMRETARQMGEKLAIVQAALAEKQAKVKDINDKLARLNQQ